MNPAVSTSHTSHVGRDERGTAGRETLDTDGTSGIPGLPKHTDSGTLKAPGTNNSLNSTRGTTAMYPLLQWSSEPAPSPG